MKKLVALTAISGLSVSLLTSCLTDEYDYSKDEPPASNVKVFGIYGSNGSDNFLMQIEDAAGTTTELDANGMADRDGISVRPAQPGATSSTLRVTIDNGAAATIRTSAISPADISAYTQNGTLQFDLKVLSKQADSQVTLSSASETATRTVAEIDITSAVRAYGGSDTQKVKIPLSCFSEVDFSQSTAPFELHSSNGISFELGNIQVASDTAGGADVIACDNIGADINDGNTSDVFIVNGPNWAPSLVTWLTDGSSLQLDWGHDNFGPNFAGVNAGVNGGMVVQTANDGNDRKDISRYIENGELRFILYVESYGIHPTKRLQVQIESLVPASGGSTTVISNPHMLDAWFAEGDWQQVAIPLKDLFTKANGQIDVNAIQNVNKPLTILPEWVEGGDSLNGMAFRVASIQLVIPQ